jgi:hypothetical protein
MSLRSTISIGERACRSHVLGEEELMRLISLLAVVPLLIVGVSLSQAAQHPPPGGDIAIEFIGVKQVVQLLDDGAKVVLVDVRSRQDYLIRHIKGAFSFPLERMDARAHEIPREGLVVLY